MTELVTRVNGLQQRLVELEKVAAVRDERHKAVILRLDNMDQSLNDIKDIIQDANKERRIVGRGLLLTVAGAFIVAGITWIVHGGLVTQKIIGP